MYFPGLDISTIALAALIPLLLGSFWYSPAVFGNQWLKLSGFTTDDVHRSRWALLCAFAGSFLASLVMSYVLALLIANLFVYTVFDGIEIGFMVWLGFVATTTLPEYLFGRSAKPYRLYLLVNGYHLVSLVIMGGLLALWI